jgi:hypothetical protein
MIFSLTFDNHFLQLGLEFALFANKRVYIRSLGFDLLATLSKLLP